MKYQDFVEQLATQTRIDPQVIRDVLSAMPTVFMGLLEGDSVRTPLGVFRMKRRKRKRVKLPDDRGWSYAPEQLRIHFNPGKRMKTPAMSN